MLKSGFALNVEGRKRAGAGRGAGRRTSPNGTPSPNGSVFVVAIVRCAPLETPEMSRDVSWLCSDMSSDPLR